MGGITVIFWGYVWIDTSEGNSVLVLHPGYKYLLDTFTSGACIHWRKAVRNSL